MGQSRAARLARRRVCVAWRDRLRRKLQTHRHGIFHRAARRSFVPIRQSWSGQRTNVAGQRRSLWDGEPWPCGKSSNLCREEKPSPPVQGGNHLWNDFPASVLAHQHRANFRYAFSVFVFVKFVSYFAPRRFGGKICQFYAFPPVLPGFPVAGRRSRSFFTLSRWLDAFPVSSDAVPGRFAAIPGQMAKPPGSTFAVPGQMTISPALACAIPGGPDGAPGSPDGVPA